MWSCGRGVNDKSGRCYHSRGENYSRGGCDGGDSSGGSDGTVVVEVVVVRVVVVVETVVG